jgi:glutathione S-transferase
MGEGAEERAFIEMADRRAELNLLLGIANCARHTHPALANLEQPQFTDFGVSQGDKMRDAARWFDAQLAAQPFIAGERFTVADITAFCALEFARGLLKFKPGAEGMAHLQAWRDRIAQRPSASAK